MSSENLLLPGQHPGIKVSAKPGLAHFYTRKRAEHKTHHQAVIALARRRVDVLHAILRNRQPYEARPAHAA